MFLIEGALCVSVRHQNSDGNELRHFKKIIMGATVSALHSSTGELKTKVKTGCWVF